MRNRRDCELPDGINGATTGRKVIRGGDSQNAAMHSVYCGAGDYVGAVVGGECRISRVPVVMSRGDAVALCHMARRLGVMGWVV